MPAEPPDGQPDAPNGAATAQPAAAAAAAAAPPPPPLKVDGDVKPPGSAELEKQNSMYTKAEEAARRRVTLRVDVSGGRQRMDFICDGLPLSGPPAARRPGERGMPPARSARCSLHSCGRMKLLDATQA